MSTVEPIGPRLVDKLTSFRSDSFDADGTVIELVELTAEQMATVWDDLEAAEGEGRVLDVYRQLLLYGAHHGGSPVFASIEDVQRLPGRLLIPMGEKMLQLCDMGLDSGNALGDQDETWPAA